VSNLRGSLQRWYLPEIGRWISEEPFVTNVLRVPDKHHREIGNLFGYARNNPLTYYDPSGNIPVLLEALITVTAILAVELLLMFAIEAYRLVRWAMAVRDLGNELTRLTGNKFASGSEPASKQSSEQRSRRAANTKPIKPPISPLEAPETEVFGLEPESRSVTIEELQELLDLGDAVPEREPEGGGSIRAD